MEWSLYGTLRGWMRKGDGWEQLVRKDDPELEAVLYRVDIRRALQNLARDWNRLVHVSGGKIPEEFYDLMIDNNLETKADLEVFIKMEAEQLISSYNDLMRAGR